MDYGVTIERGAVPWQIFQQDKTGRAEIALSGSCTRIRQSFELPLAFTRLDVGAVTVKARVALESSGESVCPWTECRVKEDLRWSVSFSVPAGGLYRIETYMEYEGWDGLSSTRGDMVHHIGVGDVFVAAGQSNAAGRAKNPIEDPPELGVHVLRASGRWDLATHPMGETTNAVHLGHFENHNPGHCPWLHFAKLLKRELGYPIGIVMSAYGGAPLRWWNPEENGELYFNMIHQLVDYRLHPKGILWYQGEAEGYEEGGATYLDRFSAFVNTLRSDLGQPDLPVVTVQLNRCMNPCGEDLDRQWGMVRQAQRDAARQLDRVWVVPAIDLSLYDFIHNSAQSNLVVGERTARCLLAEVYGQELEWKAPEAETAVRLAPDRILLKFKRVYNWLNPFEVAPALLPIEAEDGQGLVRPSAYVTGRDTLELTFPRPLAEGTVLHGAWRCDPGPCIPCDCMRLPMLAFYGLPVRER